MANRLAGESSPYLLQHKDNPVDWYPWGPEAFAVAREQDKPIFISIGYAACHWCHVMAHESFENDDIARMMNELFVNVKIDREERPDVDAIYMNAIQITGQGGGWPLSAFCTPDGKPYFLGTYFPPVERYGRTSFPQLLRIMAQIYTEQRDKVEHNTEAIMDGLRRFDEHFRRGARQAGQSTFDHGLIVTTARALAQRCDPIHGGLGTKPKFPSSSAHALLGRASRLQFGKPAREAFLLQAENMAKGGIYDHLGGGFARYSVDERWLVPHFEKMLYDNAQLLAICGDAHAMTGSALYSRVIAETITWLEREMQHSSGGLYASQDADSEGEEGKFYVWTPDQVRAVLGPADAIFFEKSYGITERGNFEHGTTVLSLVEPPGSESDQAALTALCARMFEARKERIPPDTDTKILAGWNGLAVSGLTRAWAATGDEQALTMATTVANFLANEMVHEDGTRLWRVFKDGATKLDGTVDDYAFCARAFMDMAEATGDATWWQRGAELSAVILDRFYQEEDGVGVFYMTPSDDPEPLIHRPESNSDGAIPSGAAVAIECLLRLGLVAGDQRALSIAESYLVGRSGQMAENVFATARLLAAADLYLDGVELVVTAGADRDQLLAMARRVYAPNLMIAGPWAAASLLDGKEDTHDGRAQAYVCRGQTCSAPITEPEALRAALEPSAT
ncbi:MAG: thioredoxin domain-containing protein [Myxococcota bacterium]